MLSDAEVLLHLVVTFFDVLLPSPLDAAKPAAPASSLGGALGGGSSLFGGASFCGTSNPFGGSLCSTTGSASAAPQAKSGTFWRTPEELCGFSSRHLVKAKDAHRQRSDVVLIQHAAAPDPASSRGDGVPVVAPPRYSLLCDGCEWTVAPGEHNLWECLVLFVLVRAKKGGYIGGLDLRPELYTSFMTAMTPDGVSSVKEAASPIAYHGLLSVLHPWTEQLEALSLDAVQ